MNPADDDEAVFGEAWGLIQEWRELKDTHPNRGKGLEWLQVEERLLSVELSSAGRPRPDPAAGDLSVEGPWTAAARSTGAGRLWTTRKRSGNGGRCCCESEEVYSDCAGGGSSQRWE